MKKGTLSVVFTLVLTAVSAFAASGGDHGSGGHDEKSYRNLFPIPQADLAKGTIPAVPNLQEPVFMSSVNPAFVTLKWNAVEGADSYHVQVATDANFKWLVQDAHLHKGVTYELQNLQPGQHYYWRVASFRSGNLAGTSKSTFSKSMFETK